jgi:hypothetical protein
MCRPDRRLAALALISLTLLTLLTACSTTADRAPAFAEVQPFSANRPGVDLPRGWQTLTIHRNKRPTHYDLVVDADTQRVVLHAVAARSASGLKQRLAVDPTTTPIIAWRWRVTRLIPAADATDRDAEDSPVRLLLFFDGDKRTLSAGEQGKLELARLVSGTDVPYATLMYIWENRHPVGQVIASSHTSRVQMVVAGSGSDRLGQWKSFERDYVEDYRRAFGELPRRLVGVGILTDTDNTGAEIEAFYGDIALKAAASAAVR